MKRVIVAILAVVGGLALLAFALLFVLSLLLLAPDPLPRSLVLDVDLEKGVLEHRPDDPFFLYLERDRLTARDVVEALERGAEDDRVQALLVRVGSGALGLGMVEEIRDGVERFRESGKRAILFSETFGEMMPGHGAYHLASAFDEVVLQPSGDLNVAGLGADEPFAREALDRLDLEPRLEQREEYKTAPNHLTEEGYTEAHREATVQLLESLYGELVDGIARARDRDPDEVREILAGGPFLASEALELGLVDRLGYLDEVEDDLREEAGGNPDFIPLPRYLPRAGRPHRAGTDVALIYGVGAVLRGESGYDPVFGGTTMGAETVTGAFREAIEDPQVEAILFRVDSPGGSYVASDAIRRKVERAREAGKPVVVSMGNVAASGGYLVSVGANRIVAQPSTITGSIGVFAGKVVTRGLWDRLGVNWEHVEVGENSGMWSLVRDYTPDERERLEVMVDRVYDEFVDIVADGRALTRSQVLEVAGGRVWTGREALEHGLVDELGGLERALEVVREELELEPDARLRLRSFPPERTLLQLIMEEGAVGALASRSGAASPAVARAARSLEPFFQAARQAGLTPQPGPVTAPLPRLPTDP